MREGLETTSHFVDNGEGWRLHLKRTVATGRFDADKRPLAIVPGYGMNAFIFGYHPRGTSMERHFAEAGHEVWSLDLRGQGPSKAASTQPAVASLARYSSVDLTASLDFIRRATKSRRERVDAIGASLGGTILYAHLALVGAERLGSVVAVGAPLRWEGVHPFLKAAFSAPKMLRRLRFSGTQRLARLAFPVLARIPGLLSIYMNTANVDLTVAQELTRTVEDPQPEVNAEIATWVKAVDLILDGIDVTASMADVDRPLLLVVANRDGIVPPPAALSARRVWGGDRADVLHVGDEREWFAHADLFIGNTAPERVFAPVASWLADQS